MGIKQTTAVEEILAKRESLYIRQHRIASVVSDFIGDDLEAKGRLLDAIINYNPLDERPVFDTNDGKLFLAWSVIKMDLDDDLRAYIRKRMRFANHCKREVVTDD